MPYDYEGHRDAQFDVRPFDCSVKLHGSDLRLVRGLPVPARDRRVQHSSEAGCSAMPPPELFQLDGEHGNQRDGK